jgi:hypothetical protein
MRRAQCGNEEAYSRLLQELFPLVGRMTRQQMANATSSHYRSRRAGQAQLSERIREIATPECATATVVSMCCWVGKAGG